MKLHRFKYLLKNGKNPKYKYYINAYTKTYFPHVLLRPWLDGKLKDLDKRDDKDDQFQIGEWLLGTDGFYFSWDKTTNACHVADQSTYYEHPSYGMIYIVEGAEYHSNYAEQTSYYDPETKTFHFFPAYYVSQGSFGQFEEVFEITEEGAIKRKASFRLGQDELNTSIKRVRVWKNFGKPSGRRVAQQKNNFYAAFSKDAVRK